MGGRSAGRVIGKLLLEILEGEGQHLWFAVVMAHCGLPTMREYVPTVKG